MREYHKTNETVTPKIPPSRFWRNILLIGGLVGLTVLIWLASYIATLAAQATEQAMIPPRLSLNQTPHDVGIAEYVDVSFVTSDGVTLRGWYIPPAPNNSAVIILAHGYAQNRLMLLPEAQFLTQNGYGVLLFDFRGHGESGSALVTFGDHERSDLEAAIDFAVAQPNVSKLGAIGFSMGAATLAQVAVRDRRLSAVIIESAYPTLEDEIRYRSRAFGVLSQWPALWEIYRAGVNVADIRPSDNLCAVNPRSLLLIYGELDDYLPPGTVQTMRNAICTPEEMWVVRGADHQNFMDVAPEAYKERLLNFFGR
jgi:dipeptidyl aminopeptidase/acylaminoacyl peptidase